MNYQFMFFDILDLDTVKVTAKALEQTGVEETVNSLRKNHDIRVMHMSAQIIKKWKKSVSQEGVVSKFLLWITLLHDYEAVCLRTYFSLSHSGENSIEA